MTPGGGRSDLGLPTQTGYAFGNFGKSVLWSTMEHFLLFYLTEFVGAPPAQAGLLIFVSLALDALLGPLVGYAADRTATPLGKYGPYLLAGAPLAAVAFWLLFTTATDEIGAIAAALMLFRVAYVVCDVPHNALLARLVATDAQAATVSGLRFLFSSIGALAAAAAAGAALAAAGRGQGAAAISAAAAGAGAVFIFALWVAFAATQRLDRDLPNTAARVRLGDAVGRVRTNRVLGGLLLLGFVQALTLPLFTKALVYWGAHHHGDPGWSGGALGLVAVAQALAMVGWIALGRRISPLGLARAAYATVGVSALLFAGAMLGGGPALETAALIVYGVGNGGAVSGLWALLPGAIAAGAAPDRTNVESLPTGVFLFVIKLAAGLGAAVLGVLLQGLGLGPTPSEGFVGRLGLLLIAAPACAAFGCLAASHWLARLAPPSPR